MMQIARVRARVRVRVRVRVDPSSFDKLRTAGLLRS
jgi:hypothetical protein